MSLPVTESAPRPIPGITTPVAPDERIAFLDVLRGVAIFGIFFVNLNSFSSYWALSPEARAVLPTAALDNIVLPVSHLLFEGKFYSVFSLLFGIGFAVQLLRGERRSAPVLPVFRRRLLVLAAIGAVHMTLLWSGDILLLYALLGFLLIPFRTRSDRTLLAWAASLLVLPVLLQAILAATGDAVNPGAPFRALAHRVDALFGYGEDTDWTAVMANAGWREFFAYNMSGPLYRAADLLGTHRLPKVLGMFVLGLWAGRSLRLAELGTHRRLLKRVLLGGLVLGAIGNPAMAYLIHAGHAWEPTAWGVAHAAAYAVGVAPLGLAYAAGLALLFLRPGWSARLGVLAPVGRMALTSYLAQTCVGIALFFGMGLGWAGRVGPALFLPLALAVFALQIAFSHWWLARFRFGPAEWAWRSLTLGAAQPLRRGSPWAVASRQERS